VNFSGLVNTLDTAAFAGLPRFDSSHRSNTAEPSRLCPGASDIDGSGAVHVAGLAIAGGGTYGAGPMKAERPSKLIATMGLVCRGARVVCVTPTGVKALL
jgi:hypothetical protein